MRRALLAIVVGACLGVVTALAQPPDESNLPENEKRMPPGYHCKQPEVTISKGEKAVHCSCTYHCTINPDGSHHRTRERRLYGLLRKERAEVHVLARGRSAASVRRREGECRAEHARPGSRNESQTMTAFREAANALIQSSLRCPKCPTINRPGATYVELSEDGTTAYCSVCSCSGPVARFQGKERAV